LFKFLLIFIPYKFDTPLRYLHKLHCLKLLCINVLYILCIGHLPDIPERAKQCGGVQLLVMGIQYSKAAFSIQFMQSK